MELLPVLWRLSVSLLLLALLVAQSQQAASSGNSEVIKHQGPSQGHPSKITRRQDTRGLLQLGYGFQERTSPQLVYGPPQPVPAEPEFVPQESAPLTQPLPVGPAPFIHHPFLPAGFGLLPAPLPALPVPAAVPALPAPVPVPAAVPAFPAPVPPPVVQTITKHVLVDRPVHYPVHVPVVLPVNRYVPVPKPIYIPVRTLYHSLLTRGWK